QGAAPRDGKGRGGGGEETPISHPTTYQASAPAPAPERLHRPRAHWPPPRSAPTLEGVRTVRATAAAVTAVMGAGVAAVAVGRFASDAALRIPPGGPLPTEPRLTVHATAAGQVTLTRDLAALRPGRHGLTGDGFHAVVGPVLPGTPTSADTVVRRLERVTHGTPEPGDHAWLTPNLHVGAPGTALGLDHTGLGVPGELGPLPVWFVPGDRDTWV